MRGRHKEWRNDKGGKWDARVIWYEDATSIRLQLTTLDGVQNKFYKRPDEETKAQEDYDAFRAKHKKEKKAK